MRTSTTRWPRALTRVVTALLLVAVAGCRVTGFIARPQPTDPDASLSLYLDALKRARADGGSAHVAQRDAADVVLDEHQIVAEIRRLALEFQAHAPTLFANALLCDEVGDREGSQRYLDRVLSLEPGHVHAAVMRSEEALKQGDLAFARSVLERALSVAPDAPELHETKAAVEFFSGNAPQARTEIEKATWLGAPAWRTAYDMGLIEETAGERDLALKHFASALSERPDFELARAHERALQAAAAHAPQ